jgi:histidinol-phosphate phosphatase family protein
VTAIGNPAAVSALSDAFPAQGPARGRFSAVLFDRDGTLICDVPYNSNPALVTPMPGAGRALDRLRRAGLKLGVITNQSAIGRGLATAEEVDAVNRRVEELLGPFDTWQVCPHDAYDGCGCRKPQPGLVTRAAAALGVATPACAVVGDIGADMTAAAAAGARGVLVPTELTRVSEVAAAPVVVADLEAAADWVLGNDQRAGEPAPAGRQVLAVRADSAGDVLLCGPALRALAARASHVTLLCGPRGREAADLLPGLDDVLVEALPWIDAAAPAVDRGRLDRLIATLSERDFDEALIFTSFHQSPLPSALLLRMAGIERISAISEDWPGSLLDVRHHVPAGVPEAERALSLAMAAGYVLPLTDDGRLRVTIAEAIRDPATVVVHPGTSAPARAAPPDVCSRIVKALHGDGFRVIITGAPSEQELTAAVAGSVAEDLGGRTSLRDLAAIFGSVGAVVVGNTGPAHLAASTGTPVVSLYAPTVPYAQWGPYGVPAVRLGDPMAGCAGTRATVCPVPGHPCLSRIDEDQVVAAVRTLTGARV